MDITCNPNAAVLQLGTIWVCTVGCSFLQLYIHVTDYWYVVPQYQKFIYTYIHSFLAGCGCGLLSPVGWGGPQAVSGKFSITCTCTVSVLTYAHPAPGRALSHTYTYMHTETQQLFQPTQHQSWPLEGVGPPPPLPLLPFVAPPPWEGTSPVLVFF